MKPVVFISHISEESEVAVAVKDLLAPHFLGLLDFFVSSDGASISMGQNWLDTVSAQLKGCSVQIVICSRISVTKPWINFEAGAAWIRDIPVIPLCHSGMTPSELPVPLKLLQSANLTDIGGMKLVVPVLANALGAASPKIDFTDFVTTISDFEARYTFWDQCNKAIAVVQRMHKDIIPAFRSNAVVDMDLPDNMLHALESVSTFLRTHEVLDFRRVGRSSLTANGMFYGCQLLKMAKFEEMTKSPHFKPKA